MNTDLSNPMPDPLERALAALSAPVSASSPPSPSGAVLWERALVATGRAGGEGPSSAAPTRPLSFSERLARPLPGRPLAAAALVLLTVMIGVAVLIPSLGRARSSARVSAPMAEQAMTPMDQGLAYRDVPSIDLKNVLDQGVGGSGVSPFETAKSASSPTPNEVADVSSSSPSRTADAPPTPAPPTRYVARKASIDFKAPAADIPVVFSKCSFLVSDALGEYVESSSISGTGGGAYATLLLRVQPERLSAIMNDLRKLGEVTSETSGGDDVTARVVDLDARIRNEQRIEAELLELVAKRTDAPLKEILELRTELAKVRGTIESIQSQRATIGRLVSLASVLVNIRADSAAVVKEPDKDSLWGYLADRVERSFTGATHALADSIAWLVGVAVAGAVWWLVLIACIVMIARLRRRAIRRAASEPAPVG